MPAVTVESVYEVMPEPTDAICAKVPLVPVLRSILKPVSLVELSVQLSCS